MDAILGPRARCCPGDAGRALSLFRVQLVQGPGRGPVASGSVRGGGDLPARRLDQRHAPRDARRGSPPDRQRVRSGQHRRRSGAPERSLRRRQQRGPLEVVGLRQQLDADQRHAARRPARRGDRGGGDDAGDDLGGGLQHHLQVDRRRDDVHPDHARRQPLLAEGRSQRPHPPDQRASRGRRHRRIDRRRRQLASWSAAPASRPAASPGIRTSSTPATRRPRGGPGSRSRRTAPAPS